MKHATLPVSCFVVVQPHGSRCEQRCDKVSRRFEHCERHPRPDTVWARLAKGIRPHHCRRTAPGPPSRSRCTRTTGERRAWRVKQQQRARPRKGSAGTACSEEVAAAGSVIGIGDTVNIKDPGTCRDDPQQTEAIYLYFPCWSMNREQLAYEVCLSRGRPRDTSLYARRAV